MQRESKGKNQEKKANYLCQKSCPEKTPRPEVSTAGGREKGGLKRGNERKGGNKAAKTAAGYDRGH